LISSGKQLLEANIIRIRTNFKLLWNGSKKYGVVVHFIGQKTAIVPIITKQADTKQQKVTVINKQTIKYYNKLILIQHY
jgi:hypothetical protein